MRSLLLIGSLATLAACSTPQPQPRSAKAEEHLQKMLAGKSAGEPVTCLRSSDARDMVIIDDHTILFREGRRRVWRNDVAGRCSGLGSGSYALVTRQFGGMGLCRGDIAHVMDTSSGMFVGSCSLGDFVPYTTASR